MGRRLISRDSSENIILDFLLLGFFLFVLGGTESLFERTPFDRLAFKPTDVVSVFVDEKRLDGGISVYLRLLRLLSRREKPRILGFRFLPDYLARRIKQIRRVLSGQLLSFFSDASFGIKRSFAVIPFSRFLVLRLLALSDGGRALSEFKVDSALFVVCKVRYGHVVYSYPFVARRLSGLRGGLFRLLLLRGTRKALFVWPVAHSEGVARKYRTGRLGFLRSAPISLRIVCFSERIGSPLIIVII